MYQTWCYSPARQLVLVQTFKCYWNSSHQEKVPTSQAMSMGSEMVASEIRK